MKDTALISPELPKKGVRLASTCILVANKADLSKLCTKAGLDKSFFLLSSRVFYGENRDFCAAGPFIGAPYAAIILENLAAWGCERFVFWGWCGSLSASLCTGDILIPENALAEDGTSVHYLPAGQENAVPS
ncbi:MAG: nucleoside phosphorylase, partial [Deltaproteobacteria bacterium]|nr:nucleoside phosphorylase [Deltaproteobacteria bacterium]